MYHNGVTRSRAQPRLTRRGQRGQASLIIALAMVALTLLFVIVLDVGLVEAANQQVAGYAEQVAQAGVEAATVLNGFGTGGSNAPALNPTLAKQEAQAFWQALSLGPGYTLTIVAATPTILTVRVSTTVPVYLWPGPVPVSEQASEIPQADTA
jgi:hypothetical protein